ncbi:DUF952 domain-containing protein [Lyngbya confervoides]|uniref:DUF952 domain-containing protein n=1 Tax=Lyngbya confervoides BDU141951 TaxID=1574623 RepID=A0ABD4T0Y8_9CYAN|nr:DUF952 domain-containing protein [Lyngbya confervoides]MCM1982367.1 DUF952 domain-containing protein [Lyngbya confervoides BDU141951]
MNPRLFHITERQAWEQAQGLYRCASLDQEGFIHLSTDQQVIGVANRFFSGKRDLVLLEIARDRLQSPLCEDLVPGQGLFPHLYGPLNLDAVVRVWRLEPDGDGTFVRWQ